MREQFEKARLTGVGQRQLFVAHQDFAALEAMDFVDGDEIGTMDAAEPVERELLLKRLERHKNHQFLAIGLMDVDVVAVTLDIQDVIQAYRGLHQIDLHGDGFRGGGCVAHGFHLSLEHIDILRQRTPAFFRFVVFESRSSPFVGEGDGQGKKDSKDRKDGYQYPLRDNHADPQKLGNG